MVDTHIQYSLTDAEQTKLREAVHLIREVVSSVDDYYGEDERLDTIPLDNDSTSLLRLAAMTIEDELQKHSITHSILRNLQ